MKHDTIAMLANEKVGKALLKLCIPAVAAMTINGIYNVVDAFFIGLTNDFGAIGAISVVFPLFVVMSALGIGISVGVGSFISRSLGAGKMEKAQKAAGASLIISTIVGLLATAAGFIWMKPLLYMLGARDAILPYAAAYTSWILTGSVFVILNTTFAGTIRAEGNSLYSTIAMLAGTVLNILLDPVFIFAFHMGIEGAAAATLLSYIVTFLISIWYYTGKKAVVPIQISFKSINRENMAEITKIGIPAMLKQLLLAGVFCVINMMAAGYGEAAVTAAGICAKINSFIAMTLLGITQGFMPLAAFNFGAGNFGRVFEALKKVFFAEMVFSVFGMLLYFLFAPGILYIFCKDAAVIAIGAQFLHAFGVTVIPLSIAFLMDALFFSAGNAKASLLLTASRQGFLFLPVIIIGNLFFGLSGVAWSQTVADILCCLCIALPLYVNFIKKAKPMQAEEVLKSTV